MDKTIYTQRQEIVRQALVALRRRAGLNQRQMAKRLGRERSLVARLELGQRRVDLAEFFSICEACETDAVAAAGAVMRKFKRSAIASRQKQPSPV